MSEMVVYSPIGCPALNVRLADETIWLTMQQLATVFGVDRSVIGKHIRNVYKTGELEGAEIRYEDNMHAYMCTNIDPGYDYRTELDFNEIYKRSNIINDGNIYTGAEIKYWFFMRNINCFNRKYKDYWHWVDSYSMDQIADNKNYIITGDINHMGKYHNCNITEVITTGV